MPRAPRRAMQRIEQQGARQVCFSKRRQGLFKKAAELSVLCGTRSAILVDSPGGRTFSLGEPDVASVIMKFLFGEPILAALLEGGDRRRKEELFRAIQDCDVREEAIDARMAEVNAEVNEIVGILGRRWDSEVYNLHHSEAEDMIAALSSLSQRVSEELTRKENVRIPQIDFLGQKQNPLAGGNQDLMQRNIPGYGLGFAPGVGTFGEQMWAGESSSSLSAPRTGDGSSLFPPLPAAHPFLPGRIAPPPPAGHDNGVLPSPQRAVLGQDLRPAAVGYQDLLQQSTPGYGFVLAPRVSQFPDQMLAGEPLFPSAAPWAGNQGFSFLPRPAPHSLHPGWVAPPPPPPVGYGDGLLEPGWIPQSLCLGQNAFPAEQLHPLAGGFENLLRTNAPGYGLGFAPRANTFNGQMWAGESSSSSTAPWTGDGRFLSYPPPPL